MWYLSFCSSKFVYSIYLSCLFIFLFVCVFTYLLLGNWVICIQLSICQNLFILSIYLVCSFFCLFVYLLICCQVIGLFVFNYIFVCLFVCAFALLKINMNPFFIFLFVYVFTYLLLRNWVICIQLSIYLFVCMQFLF